MNSLSFTNSHRPPVKTGILSWLVVCGCVLRKLNSFSCTDSHKPPVITGFLSSLVVCYCLSRESCSFSFAHNHRQPNTKRDLHKMQLHYALLLCFVILLLLSCLVCSTTPPTTHNNTTNTTTKHSATAFFMQIPTGGLWLYVKEKLFIFLYRQAAEHQSRQYSCLHWGSVAVCKGKWTAFPLHTTTDHQEAPW